MKNVLSLIPTLLASVLLLGCATGPNQKALNESNNALRNGDVPTALNILEVANKDKKEKDTPYYLDKGEMTKYLGIQSLSESSSSLLKADYVVQDWQAKATLNLAKDTGEFLNYFFASIGSNSTYEPKDYEKSLLSYNLALNHVLAGRWDLATVEAKKMAERETIINRIHEKSVAALNTKESENRKNKVQSYTRIDNINGYPVNLINSPEISSLKNAYQNAAAHYLAGFIFVRQGEAGMAAPGYRTALELKPNNGLFELSLGLLDKNIETTRRGGRTNSDVLFIVETGSIPRINSHKSNMTFNTPQGPKIVTFNLPVIENPSPVYNPGSVSVGSQTIILYQAANLDAMSRRQLKDDMPGYLLKASTQAITQIVAQAVAQQAAAKNNNQNAGLLASVAVGMALSVGSADVRQWSTLPGTIYMGRASVSKGENNFSIPTPSGVFSVPLQFGQDYQIVHVRILGGRAIVSTMGGTTPMSNYKITNRDTKFDLSNSLLMNSYALQ